MDLIRRQGADLLIEPRLVRVSSACKPDPEAVADLRGTYARWFRERGLRAVVMRPDYYVFGAAADLGDLPAVVDSLRHQLGGQFRTARDRWRHDSALAG